MIRLLAAIGLALMTTQAFAQIPVPKSYSDGEVIYADELNTNLKAIADAVPPRNCSTDQIIRWNGSAWVCATGDLAGLVCEEEDTITFRNGTWQCSSATPPSCTTTYYYRDYDEDGYGDPTKSQCLSSPTGLYTSTNGNDCWDYNADAKPGQTGYFGQDRGDASYDYDCDGQQEKLYTAVGSCELVVNSCNYNIGWSGGTVPSCGSTKGWITACEFQFDFNNGSTCIEDAPSRTQTCQ